MAEFPTHADFQFPTMEFQFNDDSGAAFVFHVVFDQDREGLECLNVSPSVLADKIARHLLDVMPVKRESVTVFHPIFPGGSRTWAGRSRLLVD